MSRIPALLKSRPALHIFMLGSAAVLLAFHFVHLSADFPNFSPWMDWSKYTDEGWYGDAAIRHFQRGSWYVQGDFNPAAALPVWPLLEACLFRFTGVSLVACRALTVSVLAAILIAGWVLVTRWTTGRFRLTDKRLTDKPAPLAASASVLLLAASPFCFVFTRMAILEPLLVFVTLLCLLAASAFRPEQRNWAAIVALGLLLPTLILTKTTGLFLTPAVAWLLFAAVGFRLKPFLRDGLPAACLAVCLWLAYFFLAIRPHYLLDYRYLFSANAYTFITRENALDVVIATIKYGMWMGRTFYPIAFAASVVGILYCWTSLRRLREQPLITALLLWTLGYVFFLAYHNNLQPRYYLPVAVPLAFLLPLVVESILIARVSNLVLKRTIVVVALATLAFNVACDARKTITFLRSPEYTLLTAARAVAAYIAEDRLKDPRHNPLILSISGSDISLMTGLPSICDDFGTLELGDRVALYRPGWYVAWNQIDDDKMDAMTPLFHIERVAAFPAMDDPDRNLLILYRLDASVPTPKPARKRKPTPRPLQTRVGQQPSVSQLEH